MAASASVQIEIGNYFVRNMATTEKKEKKNTFFPVYSLSRGLSTNHVGGFGCMASTVVLRTHSSFLGVVEKKRGFLLSNCIQRKRRVGQKRHKKRENPSGWNITDVSALAGVRPFGLFLFAPGPPRVRFFLSPINNLMTRPQTSSTPFNFFLSSFFFCFLAKFMNSKLTIVSFDLCR